MWDEWTRFYKFWCGLRRGVSFDIFHPVLADVEVPSSVRLFIRWLLRSHVSNMLIVDRFAIGFRNPFRLAMDPNTKSKVKFHIGDVGGSKWEEISVGGTDYAKANYGWPLREGPCKRNNDEDCAVISPYLDPLHYYEHTQSKEGGCVTGSVFVPDGLWPSEYSYLFVDFIFGEMYNMVKADDVECRSCVPPVSGYRNVSFYKLDYMVDVFFGPYNDTQALYIVSQSRVDGLQKIWRIRYTGSSNRRPIADIRVQNLTVDVGATVEFDGSNSSDPDGDVLAYLWDFGEGDVSTTMISEHTYQDKGEYTVKLTVTDALGHDDATFVTIAVGERPTAEMLSPPPGKTFYVGEVIRLSGAAVDSSGNTLPSSQLFWEVVKHHATHTHPFLDREAGNNFDMAPAPGPEDVDAATNSYLEVIMYAVDDDGLTTTLTRVVKPQLVDIQVDTFPSGLEILVSGSPITTPKTIFSWENFELSLDVDDQPPYNFTSWSDGGARSHTVLIPAASSTNLSFSAIFSSATFSLMVDARNCTSSDRCGMCEGHCQNDDECQGSLVCYKKGGRGKPVPGCVGVDESNTDWCTTVMSTDSVAPTGAPTVKVTATPTAYPTVYVTVTPSMKPTAYDTVVTPTNKPTNTVNATAKPTAARVILVGNGNQTTDIDNSAGPSQQLGIFVCALLVAALFALA